MQKEYIASTGMNIKRVVAFVIIAAMFLCALPYAPFIANAAVADANNGLDLDTVFKKGNGIYLGTYNHIIPETSSSNGVGKLEGTLNPILWEVNEVADNGGIKTVVLTSKYVLALMTKDVIISSLTSFIDTFSDSEKNIIKDSSVYLLNATNPKHFPDALSTTTPYYTQNYGRAYLKTGSQAVNWLIGNGNNYDKYVASSDGAITATPDVNTTLYGFRPSITISVDNIVYANSIAATSNGYAKSTSYYKLTIIDNTTNDLSLSSLAKASDSTVVPVNDGSVLEVDIGGTLNLTANSNKNYVDDICTINYKVVDITDNSTNYGKTIKSEIAQGSPTASASEPTRLAVRSAGLKSGSYLVYIWLQKNETQKSHFTSRPLYFSMTVTDKVGSGSPDYGALPESDFGVVVDYYNEVIRIVSAGDLGNKSYLEAATYDQAEAYKQLAEEYYKNRGDRVAFMYCLKATPTDSLREDKKLKTYLSEKWYPIYGDTIDIAKALPKTSKANKPYCVAIRKADDIFNSISGYTSRQIVPLKPRNSDSQFKKMLKYSSEKQIFSLASGSDVKVIYRMDYFPTPISATMSTSTTDSSKNIKVPADTFPLGGVLYISTMPIMENGVVTYAASKQIKIAVPKRLAEPAAKVDTSTGKIKSLKKTTTEFSYDKNTWTTYTGDVTVDIAKVKDSFPGIRTITDTTTNNTSYVLYFRTKTTVKNPASDVIELIIPITP